MRIIWLFFLFLMLVGIVSAQSNLNFKGQEGALYKECVLSFEDSEYGEWDSVLNRGVILKIINGNQQIGVDQFPSYSLQFPLGSKNYEDYNGVDSGKNNFVPILEVPDYGDAIIYYKCYLKVTDDLSIGQIPLVIRSMVSTSRVSEDFMLAEQGLVPESTKKKSIDQDIFGRYEGFGLAPEFGYFTWKEPKKPHKFYSPSKFDNKVNQNPRDYTLYPGKEPEIEFEINLAGGYSELISFFSDLEYEGRKQLVTYQDGTSAHPAFFLYRKNPAKIYQQSDACPILGETSSKNLRTNTEAKQYDQYNYGSYEVEMKKGDDVNICYILENPYSFDLNNIEVESYLFDGIQLTSLAWSKLESLSEFVKLGKDQNLPNIKTGLTILGNSNYNNCYQVKIPSSYTDLQTTLEKPVYSQRIRQRVIVKNENGADCFGLYRHNGYNPDESYLGFTVSSAFINFINGQPNVKVTSSMERDNFRGPVVDTTGYEIEFDVYKRSGEDIPKLKFQSSFDLADPDITVDRYFQGTYNLDFSGIQTGVYGDSFDIVPTLNAILPTGFGNGKIAVARGELILSSGAISNLPDKTFNLFWGDPEDSLRIGIFNPSFSSNQFEISVTKITKSDNSILGKVNVDHDQTGGQFPLVINLGPLGSEYVDIIVNRDKSDWPSTNERGSFMINVNPINTQDLTPSSKGYNVLVHERGAGCVPDWDNNEFVEVGKCIYKSDENAVYRCDSDNGLNRGCYESIDQCACEDFKDPSYECFDSNGNMVENDGPLQGAECQSCEYEAIESSGICDLGTVSILVRYESPGNNQCPSNKLSEYRCSEISNLAFFSKLEFILGAILIVLSYLLFFGNYGKIMNSFLRRK